MIRLNKISRFFCKQRATIFDKILSKQIPSKAIYEDQKIYCFDDINPQAPIHVLMIPKLKQGLTGISQARQSHIEILGYIMSKVPEIAKLKSVHNDGYRIVINEGVNGQQTVQYLHVHLLGGRLLGWPPG